MYSYLTIFSYALSVVSVIMGFFKMFIYSDGGKTLHTVNYYVGSDAYNLIINAGYSIAWFVLAIFFLILGFIFYYVNQNNK